MISHNRLSLRKLLAILLVGSALNIAGCTVTPKSGQASDTNEGGAIKVDADCGADCKDDENGVGRYQYYLGILSVLLIG